MLWVPIKDVSIRAGGLAEQKKGPCTPQAIDHPLRKGLCHRIRDGSEWSDPEKWNRRMTRPFPKVEGHLPRRAQRLSDMFPVCRIHAQGDKQEDKQEQQDPDADLLAQQLIGLGHPAEEV